MIVSAHQPHYLPWIGYFNKIHLSDVFMIMDNMVYTSKGFISKNRILTNKGWQYLTVPLIKPNGFQTKINELIIENESQANWKIKHLRTIKHHYQKGQGFDHFFPIFENELLKKSYHYFELQLRLIKCIVKYLNISTEIKLGSEQSTGGIKERELIINILKDSDCSDMLLGIGASNKYIDKTYITSKGYRILGQEFSHPKYEQINTSETINGLSVIDLIFNTTRQDAETIVKNCGKIKQLK